MGSHLGSQPRQVLACPGVGVGDTGVLLPVGHGLNEISSFNSAETLFMVCGLKKGLLQHFKVKMFEFFEKKSSK